MNCKIEVVDASVEIPLYQTNHRSIKKNLFDTLSFGKINFEKGAVISAQPLSKISFSLESGDRLGVIGTNGSGKSTLLRLLAGVYKPQIGSVNVIGNVTSIIEPAIGLDQFLTGYENIQARIMLLTHGRKFVSDDLFEKIKSISGLGGFLDLPVHTYSTGMLMRLNFAISIAINPQILLLDEWLGVTDKNFVDAAEMHMKNFVDSAGIVVLASHDMNLIKRVCNKVLLLQKGEMMYFGATENAVNLYEALC